MQYTICTNHLKIRKKKLNHSHGATYTVDKDGYPVRPRYRGDGNKSVDTVRLRPVFVVLDVATSVVKKDKTDGRLRVSPEIDLKIQNNFILGLQAGLSRVPK